ncbi:MAG TPA: peroxiredoxin [Candidatus Limnocylindria bacterium]|nr:peroxiredoxin [Candidatus Limnocylindria bacterium]
MTTMVTPDVGQQAPDFRLRGPDGVTFLLSEYLGNKHVVLVFYPLAFSPVCSHQLPAIQKELARFGELDAQVLGISVDSHYANQAFAKQLGVEFPLLSDFKRDVSAAYGVLNPETQCSGRAVFVVDKRGRIAYKDVSPPADQKQIPSNQRVLQALQELQG